MKTKKAQMKKKNNIFFGSRNKGDKRAIQVKGSWKAVELDPSLFSEEGMGGIVCFEELTDYRLMDSSKVGVKTSELNQKDKKAKKRKSSEIDDDDGGEVAEECEGEDEATETGKKQVKKKKKIKKVSGEESTKPDNIPLESSVSGEEKKEQPPCPKTDADDDTVEDGATEKKTLEEPPSSEIDAQSQSKTKKKKKKNQKKRQVDADNDTVEDGASEEKKLEEPASAEIDEKKLEEPASAEIDEKKLEEPASAEINAQSQSKTKKKKKKKQKKRQADADDDTVEVGASDETKVEEPTSSEMDARSQSKTENKNKMQKKKPEEKPTAPEAQTEQESQTDLDVQATEQPSQDQVSIIPQKKARNWSNGALSGSDQNTDVSAWKGLFVPAPVLKALSSLGFGSPTPIQALALPPAIRDHMDIVGAAETGSGKTLSFGIPMIHHILEWKKGTEEKEDDDEQNKAITKVESLYIPDMDESTKASDDEDDNDGASVSSVEVDAEFTTEQGEGSIVDDEEEDEGIAEEDKHDTDNDDEDQMEEDDDNLEEDGDKFGCVKVIENIDFEGIKETSGSQGQPLLGLVLTPTRELAVQVKHHIDAVAKFTGIKTALIVGGMAAQKQARMLKRQPEIVIATPGRLWELIKERNPHLQNLRQLQCLVIDEADRMVERGHFVELESLLEMLNTVHFNPKRQTFVFSATLTMAHSLPTRLLQKKRRLDKRSQLEILMEKVGIKSKPKVIDLTRKEATVETLIETKIHCDKDEKDFILYYFLLQYPGRTMVFANSIDCIKRLNSLLVILDRTPLPLHANMHQKQRLKNLERFAERESCVLLTTDVAARGLDIPNVQHVFHYQVPRTSETYVHRSGRTARAAKEGLSLLLIGPDDMMNFKKISKALGKDEDLPMFPIESKCMTAIKERVNLARKIEKIEYHNGKEKQHNSWFKKAAEALDMDLDDDLLLGGGQEEEHDREHQKMVKGMKKHLKHLLSQPVFKHEIKTKYPTQMGKLNLPQMRMETAITSVSNQKKKRKHKKEQPQQ